MTGQRKSFLSTYRDFEKIRGRGVTRGAVYASCWGGVREVTFFLSFHVPTLGKGENLALINSKVPQGCDRSGLK